MNKNMGKMIICSKMISGIKNLSIEMYKFGISILQFVNYFSHIMMTTSHQLSKHWEKDIPLLSMIVVV